MQSFMESWELAADFGLGFAPFRLDAKWVPLGLQHYLKCARTLALQWDVEFDFWAEFGPLSVGKSIRQYGWSSEQDAFLRVFPHHQAYHRQLFELVFEQRLLEAFFQPQSKLETAMAVWSNHVVDSAIKLGKQNRGQADKEADKEANKNAFDIKLGVVFQRLDTSFSSHLETNSPTRLEEVFWWLCLLIGPVNYEQFWQGIRSLEDGREQKMAASFFVFYKFCTDVKFKDQSVTKPLRAEEVFDMDYSCIPLSQRAYVRLVFGKLAGLRGTAQLRRAQFFPRTIASLDAFLLAFSQANGSLLDSFLETTHGERPFPNVAVQGLKTRLVYAQRRGAL